MATQVSNPYEYTVPEGTSENSITGVPGYAKPVTWTFTGEYTITVIPDRKTKSVIGWDATDGYGQAESTVAPGVPVVVEYDCYAVKTLSNKYLVVLVDGDMYAENTINAKINGVTYTCTIFSTLDGNRLYRGSYKGVWEVGVPVEITLSQP